MLYHVLHFEDPVALALILTHIFFSSLVERNEMVEVVIHSAIRLGLIGHFTKSICNMWVRIRALALGMKKWAPAGASYSIYEYSTKV